MDMNTPVEKHHPVILFDGVCNLCNGFVQFIIRRDPQAKFRFASLQSEAGRHLLEAHQLPTDSIDTVVLIDQGKAFLRSDVPLRMAGHLGGAWALLTVFQVLPKGLRDRIYDFIAARRYRWFGKKDQCMIPTPDLQARFLA